MEVDFMNSTTNEQNLKIEQAEKQIKEIHHPSFVLKNKTMIY